MKLRIFNFLPVAVGVALLALPCGAQQAPVAERRYDTHKFVGLGGFQFLKVGQGARAVGMGDAFTAAADDINAIFWNPAGLTSVRRTAWTATYTKWLVESHFFSGAVVLNTGSSRGGVIGFSVLSYRPPTMEETTIFQPDGTGETLDAGDLAVGVVYALKLTDKFSFSSRVSWVHQTLYTKRVDAVSFDVGTLFFTGFKSLRLAMVMRNLGPDRKVLDSKFIMPLYYNLALAGEVFGERGGPAYLTLSGESAFAADYQLRAHAGAELWIRNILALRGGYKFNYDTDSFSVGVGLKYKMSGERGVTVDVSYSGMGKYFSAPLRLTLGGTF